MANPAISAMVADLTGSAVRGRAFGMFEFASNGGAILGPLLGGWLYDAAGPATPFYLNGVVLGTSAIAVVFLLRHRPQSTMEA